VKTEQNEIKLNGIKKSLKSILSTEIEFMREVLGNMSEEQEAILNNNTENLKKVLSERETHMCRMNEARVQRIEIVKEFSFILHGVESWDGQMGTQMDLDKLLDKVDSDSCEILTLRDQILALLEKMNTQNGRNNYLLENKIKFNRELMSQLQPEEKNPTYDLQGDVKKKTKVATVTIINREG
jgi:flagellar biosynthesis/type III secretory pathway chaperone